MNSTVLLTREIIGKFGGYDHRLSAASNFPNELKGLDQNIIDRIIEISRPNEMPKSTDESQLRFTHHGNVYEVEYAPHGQATAGKQLWGYQLARIRLPNTEAGEYKPTSIISGLSYWQLLLLSFVCFISATAGSAIISLRNSEGDRLLISNAIADRVAEEIATTETPNLSFAESISERVVSIVSEDYRKSPINVDSQQFATALAAVVYKSEFADKEIATQLSRDRRDDFFNRLVERVSTDAAGQLSLGEDDGTQIVDQAVLKVASELLSTINTNEVEKRLIDKVSGEQFRMFLVMLEDQIQWSGSGEKEFLLRQDFRKQLQKLSGGGTNAGATRQ